jgi:hypothetical protein
MGTVNMILHSVSTLFESFLSFLPKEQYLCKNAIGLRFFSISSPRGKDTRYIFYVLFFLP